MARVCIVIFLCVMHLEVVTPSTCTEIEDGVGGKYLDLERTYFRNEWHL